MARMKELDASETTNNMYYHIYWTETRGYNSYFNEKLNYNYAQTQELIKNLLQRDICGHIRVAKSPHKYSNASVSSSEPATEQLDIFGLPEVRKCP